MQRYFAPLEGVTNFIYRRAFNRYYGGVDKYFAPFIAPADNCPMTPKEKREVLPENNQGMTLVPQILTCKSNHFIESARKLADMGYDEINLNVGCPSGTVCAKGKGSGFLANPEKLKNFLDDIYEYAESSKMKISVKTRIGRNSEDEWEELLELFNHFPVYELIVHPRIGVEFYRGVPRMGCYDLAYKEGVNPLVYNGDLNSMKDVLRIEHDYPDTKAVMLGRGLISNPEMLINQEGEFDFARFRSFHDEIYEEYKKIMQPDINVLHRMKELWTYWEKLFPGEDRLVKKIIKCKKYSEYDTAVRQLGI